MQRTLWAEKFFDNFSSIPLTAECIFRSPQYIKSGKQKEVCDFLLMLRDNAILVSMKSQENPLLRMGYKLQQWIIKNAMSALKQAKGALKTIAHESFWCQHWRRGRVDFKQGSICVAHIIVLTEVFNNIIQLPRNISLLVDGVPVTYLSLNDFLNLVNKLRAFPDIMAYLDARKMLPNGSLQLVGHEIPFYEYYISNAESFKGCGGYTDAKIYSETRIIEWQNALLTRISRQKYAYIVEYISDALATRLKNYANGLDTKTKDLFDPMNDRRNYLLMQEELCDLRLSERIALGEQFIKIMEKMRNSNEIENMKYMAFYIDSKPDFIYVLVSEKGIKRTILHDRLSTLLRAALAFYKKKRGMAIADRNGSGFEVQLCSGLSPNFSDEKLGEDFFAKLKVSDIII